MKIICINDKGSKKLLKGEIYEVRSIYSDRKFLILFKLGKQMKSRFTKLNGDSIDGVDYQNTSKPSFQRKYISQNVIQNGEIKEGDLVQCNRTNLKSVHHGELYKIEEIIDKQRKSTYNNRIYHEYYFKLEGVKRKLKVYNFIFPNKSKVRKNKLIDIFGDKEKENKKEHKITFDEMMRFLSDFSKVKSTIKRLGYSVSPKEFLLDKYNYNEEFFNEAINYKIKDIINI